MQSSLWSTHFFQSAAEYTDCTSEEGEDHLSPIHLMSVLDMTLNNQMVRLR